MNRKLTLGKEGIFPESAESFNIFTRLVGLFNILVEEREPWKAPASSSQHQIRSFSALFERRTAENRLQIAGSF